jgi:hypothetical protein
VPSTTRILKFPGSTAIDEVRYDLTTQVMTVRFPRSAKTKKGKWLASTWEFSHVASDDFAAFAIADSPGGYFNQNIRTKYPASRLSPPPVAPETKANT